MTDCIFCKISEGQIPAKLLYQDDELFAFEDIAPQAPSHILICPRKHVVSLSDASEADAAWMGRALLVAAQLAKERGIQSSATAWWSTMAPRRASPSLTCISTCSADATFAGRRDKPDRFRCFRVGTKAPRRRKFTGPSTHPIKPECCASS